MRVSTAGGTVALCLAFGFALGFNVFCFAVLYTAITSDAPLSENATQVLTGWGGGMVGVIGSYIGYRVGMGEMADKGGGENGSD
jgi:hypothetical protein